MVVLVQWLSSTIQHIFLSRMISVKWDFIKSKQLSVSFSIQSNISISFLMP